MRRRIDDACRRHAGEHALVPLPVASRVGGGARRVGGERRHRAGAASGERRAAELGHALELADLAGERDLVADDRHVAVLQVGEGAQEDEDPVGARRIRVRGGVRVLEVEAVVRSLV